MLRCFDLLRGFLALGILDLIGFPAGVAAVTIAPLPDITLVLTEPDPVIPLRLLDVPNEGQNGIRFASRTSVSGLLGGIYFRRSGSEHTVLLMPGRQAVGTVEVALGVSYLGQTQWTTFHVTLKLPDFMPESPSLDTLAATAGSWADVNGDGGMEILLLDRPRGDGEFLWFLSDGSPVRRSGILRDSTAVGRSAKRVAWTDLDGNGLLDAVLERPEGLRTVWAVTNLGIYPVFSTLPGDPATQLMGQAAWGDLDQDGDDDLVISGFFQGDPESHGVRLYRNDRGTDLTPTPSPLPKISGPLAVGDFDRDGLPDIFLADSSGKGPSRVWRNQGGLRFEPGPLEVPASTITAAGAVDFDGDGRLDLWTLIQAPNPGSRAPIVSAMTLYRQHDDGLEAGEHLDPEVWDAAGAPAWGDLDADGDLDFVGPRRQPHGMRWIGGLGRPGRYWCVYVNDGRGGFTPGEYAGPFGQGEEPPANPPAGYSAAVADLNRDGRLDFWHPFGFRALVSRVASTNVPPQVPHHLTATSEGGAYTFQWAPAVDPNQTAPLSYNLRVGTRPGANDVVPSLSLADGTRQVTAGGNCGFLTMRRITFPGLDVTNLYWSVQAVDVSFAGSPWAPEQRLELPTGPNEAPRLELPGEFSVREDELLRIPYTVTDDRTPPQFLCVRAFSSDPGLIPLPADPAPPGIASRTHSIRVPQGRERTLIAQPVENAHGVASLRVEVADREGAVTSRTVRLTVLPVNDPPSLRTESPWDGPRVLLAGTPSRSFRLRFQDVDDPPEALSAHGVSSDPAIVPQESLSVEGLGALRDLVLRPVGHRTGAATVSVVVADPSGATDSIEIPFEVVNHRFGSALAAFEPLTDGIPLAGDLDADGDLDVVWDAGPLGLTRWFNDGTGRFPNGRHVAGPVAVERRSLLTDLDGDQHLDLVVSEWTATGAPLLTWHRHGEGRLEGIPLPLPSARVAGAYQIGAADADGDGDMDLIIAQVEPAFSALRYQVLENARAGFQLGPASRSRLWPAESPVAIGLRLGDLDANRVPDVVVQLRQATAASAGSFSSAVGRADLTFSEGIVHWEPGGPLPWPADLNGDGRVDWLQGSDAAFRSEPGGLPSRIPSGGAAGFAAFPVDLDNDGRVDRLGWNAIAYGQLDQSLHWVATDSGYLPETTSVGDFNGDGWMDLLTQHPDLGQGVSHPRAELLLGHGTVANRRPHPPGGLQAATIAPGTVRLTWDAAVDPNQTDALTYNLRIGTSPGGGDVMPPLSLPDGTRLLVARGNVGGARRWVVSGLTPGHTYHAAVQAVDNAYAGGPFSSEQVFTVTPEIRPPVLVDGAVTTNGWSLRAEGAPGERLHLETGSDLKSWNVEQWLSLDDFGEGVWHRPPGASNGPLLLLRAIRP